MLEQYTADAEMLDMHVQQAWARVLAQHLEEDRKVTYNFYATDFYAWRQKQRMYMSKTYGAWWKHKQEAALLLKKKQEEAALLQKKTEEAALLLKKAEEADLAREKSREEERGGGKGPRKEDHDEAAGGGQSGPPPSGRDHASEKAAAPPVSGPPPSGRDHASEKAAAPPSGRDQAPSSVESPRKTIPEDNHPCAIRQGMLHTLQADSPRVLISHATTNTSSSKD